MAFNDTIWLNIAIMDKVNLYVLDFSGVMPSACQSVRDLFFIANQQAERTIFNVIDVSTSEDILPDGKGLLFIPPSLSSELPTFNDPEILSILKNWHHSGAVLVSACASVFWLANAGLLDGKYATTHWKLCERLACEFPAIKKVCVHKMVVDQGEIVTAAGLYAFQDLALHIMARYAGFELAKRVADYCLLDLTGRLQAYYHRFIPNFAHRDEVILKAQEFCAENFFNAISVSTIAEFCHISERSLLRRFKSATGLTPKQYVIQLRIEKAKQLMELESLSIEAIGYEVGYMDVSNFTKIFKKTSGVTPAEFKFRVGIIGVAG